MTNKIEHLNWRYATKSYDTTKKVSDQDLDTILEAIRLSPSSYGLTPYKIINVTNAEVREKLKMAAWNQPQITDASNLLIFAVSTNLSEKDIESFINLISKTRNVETESLKGFSDMINGTISSLSSEHRIAWASRQAYIALGFGLEICADLRIDSTPMEGFDSKQFDEILGLNEMNLTSIVALAIGYRAENDDYANLEKVRFAKEDLIIQK
jgi:nitroreductase